MDPTIENTPRTVDEVFADFLGRRAGILKALTIDVKEFFVQCSPDKENLCLYGFPGQHWEVNLPAEEVPPELPEPALGINFARDGMSLQDWLALVAVHSDAWLISVAFYFGARFGFDYKDRNQLFRMINEHPTILEEVNRSTGKTEKGKAKVKEEEEPTVPNHGRNKSKSNSKVAKNVKLLPQPAEEEEEEEEEEGNEEEDEDAEEEEDDGSGDDGENTLCGACYKSYAPNEFWICCDVCQVWFHGKCVKMTAARAEHVKRYKCPSCSNKRART